MEALLAISGLLAAVGVGLVGIGYARSQQQAQQDAQDNLGDANGNPNPGGPGTLTAAVTAAMASFRSNPNFVGYKWSFAASRVEVETSGGTFGVQLDPSVNNIANVATLRKAVTAQLASATTQSAGTQSSASANAQATANAVGTSTANLDRALLAYQPFLNAGLTLDEAEADVEGGNVTTDELQKQVYPAYVARGGGPIKSGETIVRVPWAPPGAPAGVGTPGGTVPTSYGVVVKS